MSDDKRARLKQWLESGEARLAPLTFPQRELWETSPVPPGDPANHICSMIRVRGSLTAKVGAVAMQRVVDRQEALRISILPGKDRPLQMVRSKTEANIRFRELTASEAAPAAVEALAQEIYDRPFDLVGGPLYRAEVLHLGDKEHVLVFAIHHSIADGWSLGVFVQDLVTAYVQGLAGRDGPLPPVPCTYTEWGTAERARWQPAEGEARLAFWRERLRSLPKLWDSPSPAPLGRLDRWVSHLPSDLGAAVRELARAHGATLFSTLLAVFQLALSQWTGAADLVVGTPVANRTHRPSNETMGSFAGVVPLRGTVDRAQPFSEALHAVHEDAAECFSQALPFAELARGLSTVGPIAPGGVHPVFQVRFALQNHPVPDVDLPTLSARLQMRSTGTARFDLGCEVTEIGDLLEVVWLFRPQLFSLAEVQSLKHLFQSILAGVCRSPSARCHTLAI